MTDARRDILSVTPFLLTPYRSLVEIGTKYAGFQSERTIANGVLNFDMSTAGRRAIVLNLADVKKNFNGKRWGQIGPELMGRVFRIMCGTEHISMGSRNVCLTLKSPSTPSAALTLQDCTFLTLDLSCDFCNYIYNFSKQH
jgi:hypothetical protein